MTTEEERDLLHKARGGDTAAFRKLIEPIRNKVYWRALKATKCADYADDITQEVCIKAFLKLDTFRGDSKFSTWVFTINSNCIRMHLRSMKRKGALSIEDHALSVEKGIVELYECLPSDPHEEVSTQQILDIIREGIKDLPPKYREVIELWVNDGFNLREIEAYTGMSIPAIKTRLHRARTKLKEYLRQKESQTKCWGSLLAA